MSNTEAQVQDGFNEHDASSGSWDDEDDLEESLLDVQATMVLNPMEERIIQTVSRAMFGALLCWVSLQRLMDEMNDYKIHRQRRRASEQRRADEGIG